VTGEPGHWQEDHWVLDKHPFELGVDNRCTECGQPESNASHPPLPEEEPVRESLDDQMTRAIGNMKRLGGEVVLVDRTGWTREQWVAEAEEIMDDIDGSVLALLNGHIMAVFEELHDLRRRNLSAKALRTFDMQTVLRVSPVITAAQNWLTANEALWNEADGGKGVAGIPESPNFKPSVKAIKDLEQAVRTYNAIVEAEEQGKKNG